MENIIPEQILKDYFKLQQAGFKVYFVGGCVRNYLMNISVKDWDLTTDATPEEIQKVFPHSFYDNVFGTVGVPFEQKENPEAETPNQKNYFEITTFRTESGYSNARHPEKVEWGKSIEEDLSRRDFTMNAIAAEIIKQDDKFETKFTDPYDGQKDIEEKIIQTVGDPDTRFGEDALRLLRAIRFATQLTFKIEDKAWESILKNSQLITKISGERIRDELFKILEAENPYNGILLLNLSGMLDLIFPELAAGKGVSQVRPGRHHTTDVFEHNILSLKETPSQSPLVRLAALLHDVGKPFVRSEDAEGHVIFYNHEVKGSRIAWEIADRLRLSKKQREKIVTLIRWHMFTVDEHITDSAVRRFIRRIGIENVADMMDLRIGDRLGGGTQVAESWRLKLFKERITKELNPPFSMNDMLIDGNDIMKELDMKPGPKLGKLLNKLFEEVDQDLSKNNREYLIQRIHEIKKDL